MYKTFLSLSEQEQNKILAWWDIEVPLTEVVVKDNIPYRHCGNHYVNAGTVKREHLAFVKDKYKG